MEYSLVSEETVEKLVNFRAGVEIISSHNPIIVQLASGREVIKSDMKIQFGRTKKI
jgi:hypothetical protein